MNLTAAKARRAVTTVVILGVFALTVVQGRSWLSDREDRTQNQEVALVAEKVAVGITSLSSGQSPEAMKGFSDLLTAKLRDELLGNGGQLTALLTTAKVKSEGTVVTSGVSARNDKSARVLVAIDAVVVNQAAPKGETRRYRMAVTLQNEGDTWLATAVELVP